MSPIQACSILVSLLVIINLCAAFSASGGTIPWMVTIQKYNLLSNREEYLHHCVGVLGQTNVVFTSKKCLDSFPENTHMVVFAGTLNKSWKSHGTVQKFLPSREPHTPINLNSNITLFQIQPYVQQTNYIGFIETCDVTENCTFDKFGYQYSYRDYYEEVHMTQFDFSNSAALCLEVNENSKESYCTYHKCEGNPENAGGEVLTKVVTGQSYLMGFWDHDDCDKNVRVFTRFTLRVVNAVAGNSEVVTLDNLIANTQYQLTIIATFAGKKYRSRPIVFRTLEQPRTQTAQDPNAFGPGQYPHSDSHLIDEYGDYHNSTNRELPTIRGVEIGIVVLVLIVWAGAIALFFNRWGKIRMLLPYQPDYKQEQLKVPGTGVCTSSTCNGQHSHQHFHHWQDEPSTAIAERCTRNRINSAIFVSSEGKGFDSIEFLRRYGSQSVLCRKAKSAENINSPEKFNRFEQYRNFETFELTETRAEESPTDDETQTKSPTSDTTLEPTIIQATPKLANLPTLSVSSPSPPHEEEFL